MGLNRWCILDEKKIFIQVNLTINIINKSMFCVQEGYLVHQLLATNFMDLSVRDNK